MKKKNSLICIPRKAFLRSFPQSQYYLSIPPCSSQGSAFFPPCSPFRLLIPVFHANRNGRIRAGGSAQHGRPIPCSTISLLRPRRLRESLQSLCVLVCAQVRFEMPAEGLPRQCGMHVGGAAQYCSQETVRCCSY